MEEQSLESLVALILADLADTNYSTPTHHAYATDLAQLSAFYQGTVQTITAEVRAWRRRHNQHLSARED